MRISSASVLAASAMLFSSPAIAAAACSGTLSGVITQDDGAILINSSWRGNFTQICNVDTIWNGINPQVCWAWFAQANTAVTESRSVIVYYANEPSNACPTPADIQRISRAKLSVADMMSSMRRDTDCSRSREMRGSDSKYFNGSKRIAI